MVYNSGAAGTLEAIYFCQWYGKSWEIRIKPRFRIVSLLLLTAIVALGAGYWTYQTRRKARIERCLDLIAQLDGENVRNPAILVEVVNELRSLGLRGATETLSLFDASRIGGKENIVVLMPLVFERIDPSEKLPYVDLYDRNEYNLERESWGHSVQIVDGIPFGTNMYEMNYSGIVYSRRSLLRWANERADVIRTRLVPGNDPFATADKLVDRLIAEYIELSDSDDVDRDVAESGQAIPSRVRNTIRDQVFEMVCHLVPDFDPPEWRQWADSNEAWESLRKQCLERGLKWSSSKNAYVFTR